MSEPVTYNNRSTEEWVVTKIDGTTVTASNGYSAGVNPHLFPLLAVGSSFLMETVNFSRITGQFFDGRWWGRKSDQDLERERQEFIAKMDRERAEALEANRAEWERRTCALPEWARERIAHFIDSGGKNFALNGWGYELVVCELAALFTAPDFADTEAVSAYCRDSGVSGNQHGMARALAKAHHEGVSLAGTVSALSPLTGDPDYGGTP